MVRLPSRGAQTESARISVVEELLPGRLLACGGQVPPSPFFVLMLADFVDEQVPYVGAVRMRRR